MADERMTTIFQGTPKLIRLISDRVSYGPRPQADAEVEQRITITADGRVFFSAFNYADGLKYRKARSSQSRITKDTALRILNEVCAFFSASDKAFWATDVGTWTLAITNTMGMTYLYHGSLCVISEELSEISIHIREILDMTELYLFDGAGNQNRIEKVILEYQQLEILQPPALAFQEQENAALRYYERIVVDRNEGVLNQFQQYGSGCEVKKEIHLPEVIRNLLDEAYSETLFSEIHGNPADTIVDPHIERNYRITVVYRYGEQQQLIGTFDKNGLPIDYPEFAESILDFMQHFINVHEMLNPTTYKRALRREHEYIYLSVTFDENGKEYYYRTTDETFEEGDLCYVPAGKDNHEAIALVVKVEYFSENDVPLPLEKTKTVIRKYDAILEGE